MAAPQSLQAKPHATRHAVRSNGFHHVFRTSGGKTAGGGQKRGNQIFIALEGGDHNSLHRANIRPISLQSSSKGASRTLRRGLKTMEHRAGRFCRCLRTASRIRRFSRLRTTALPTARGTVKPKRVGNSLSPERRQKAAK